MRHTDLPKVDANFAAVSPADPPPITIISYVVDGVVCNVDDVGFAAAGDGRMQILLLQYCLADVKVDGTNASTRLCRMMHSARRHTKFVRIIPSDVGMM